MALIVMIMRLTVIYMPLDHMMASSLSKDMLKPRPEVPLTGVVMIQRAAKGTYQMANFFQARKYALGRKMSIRKMSINAIEPTNNGWPIESPNGSMQPIDGGLFILFSSP